MTTMTRDSLLDSQILGLLGVHINSLQEDHARLETLVNEKNAGNVDELVELVHENQIILRQMKVSCDSNPSRSIPMSTIMYTHTHHFLS